MDGIWNHRQCLVNDYLAKQHHYLSAYSFVNIYIWKDFFDFQFEVIDGCLCVFAGNQTGSFLYLPPLGVQANAQTIDKVFGILEERNRGNGVSRIENVDSRQARGFDAKRFNHYQRSYEYLYYKDHIVNLKGNRYKAKRSSINQFCKNNVYEINEFNVGMISGCLRLHDGWAKERKTKNADDIYITLIEENRQALNVLMENFQDLKLIGRVVTIKDKIKAFSFGYPVNGKIFCILYEVADLSIQGLAAFIFRQFCADKKLGSYKFINVMDDFEMPNVKKAKLSYNPDILLSSYSISRKK